MKVEKVLFIAILFVVSLVCLPERSNAADWVLVGKSQDGNMSAFIDRDSIIQTSGDIVKCRQKFSYAKPIFLNNPKPKRPVRTLIAYREWDCSGEKYNDLQVTFCYANGTNETETYEYALWHYIKQGSVESDLFDYVCNQD
jgi:hypothetical protein